MKKSEFTLENLPQAAFRVMSSYGLMVVVLVFMLVLTLFGTLEQTHRGIYDVQEEYFNSPFVVHWIGSFPVPLPGAYLLMVILFFNLLCGAIIRARKDWRRPGMLVAHSGILVLLLGGMISTHFSKRGYMQVFEGDTASEFVSFIDWHIEIAEAGEDGKLVETAFVIGSGDLEGIGPDERRFFRSDALPFEIGISGYARHARPVPGSAAPAGAKVVDGFGIQELAAEKEAELHMPAMVASFRGDGIESELEAILWGGQLEPFTVTAGGRRFAVSVTKKKWATPFEVRLDEFIAEYHPGSEIPAKFESYITKVEDGVEEKVKIWMNHPLRHEGFTLFQRSFGSAEDDPRAGRQYSVFDVVQNPADQWPLYSLLIVGFGLLVHFVQKLWNYLRGALSKRAATA